MSAAKPLQGKVALVTGASRGIGRAIAEGYAAAGARVACLARTQADLQHVVEGIIANDGAALPLVCDVVDEQAVLDAVATLKAHYRGLDILVANAGVNLDKASLTDSDSDNWKATVGVNLFGVYHCLKATLPLLRQSQAGKIITIGSGLGHRGIPERSAYAASKAASWMLTHVAAQELAGENIAVNELIPGPVKTSMSSDTGSFAENILAKSHEWEKTPADVLPLALFLATQPATGPTGQSFSLMRR